jgi:DnaJ-class molecular chaperone
MNNTLYNFLSVSRGANSIQIQERYDQLKKQFKDKNDKVNLSKLFECYNILSNKESRKLYDTGILNIDLDEIVIEGGNILFENLFIKQYLQQNENIKGKDINKYVDITLLEAYQGCQKEIKYRVEYPCQKCVEICKQCDGNKIIKKKRIIAPGFLGSSDRTCDICLGLGYVYMNYTNIKCEICDGKQLIHSIVKEEVEIPEKMVVCNICNGKKKYEDIVKVHKYKNTKCTLCKGTGIIIEKEYIVGNIYKTKDKECPDCNGNKIINTDIVLLTSNKRELVECKTCNDEGKILIPKKYIIIDKDLWLNCEKCYGKGFKVLDKKKCQNCKNRFYTFTDKKIYVKLFPGIENGHKFIISGNGEQILNGNPGDLIVTINTRQSGIFKRINENLKINLNIHFVRTITGCSYKITLPSSEILELNTKTFNEIINPLKLYVYKKKGMPIYNINEKKIIDYGDLYIQFDIIYGKISKNISENLIKQLESSFIKIYDDVEYMDDIKNNFIIINNYKI